MENRFEIFLVVHDDRILTRQPGRGKHRASKRSVRATRMGVVEGRRAQRSRIQRVGGIAVRFGFVGGRRPFASSETTHFSIRQDNLYKYYIKTT